MKHIYFTVTNDLSFDQRMHRICDSLSASGYTVTLVGRKRKSSLPLQEKKYNQKRLNCYLDKGFLFYAEYNLRLLFFLFFKKMDALCAIDLDTILPCLLISKLKSIPRVYDAHEYFTEMKEIRTRPLVKKVWQRIESFCVPKFKSGYTVSNGLAGLFKQKYNCDYITIRNMPLIQERNIPPSATKFLLYQGAVNEGRGFEYLIPAMQHINYPLIVCGDGNFMQSLKNLIIMHKVQDKVILKGMLLPEELRKITPNATIGIDLTEDEGLHHYYALPNKFFDYIHAALPQLAMNLPEYKAINDKYKVAVLLDSLDANTIAKTLNSMMKDEYLLQELKENCLKARLVFNWQQEEKKLLAFYRQTIGI